MSVFTSYIELNTKGKTDVIDLTSQIKKALEKSKITKGAVTVFAVGSTGAVTTIEYEHALISDIQNFFEKIIPSNQSYAHDETWGDANGHSHLRASLLGASLTVPIINGSLCLGTWQQIIFIDFDNRPRRRKIVLQFIG